MEGLVNLHHDLMFFLTFIFFFVAVVLARTVMFFHNPTIDTKDSQKVVHGTFIEIV